MRNEIMIQKIVGILGGGQLGKMMLQKAADFNLVTHVLDPAADAPCRYLCHLFTQGSFNDYDTVLSFGMACDIITIEIENVNVDALYELQKRGKEVYPQPHIIAMIQDKGLQKNFYNENKIATAAYKLVNDISQIDWPFPYIQKMRTQGYDGKGVRKIDNAEELSQHGFTTPSVIEELVNFEKEIAVIVARNASGDIAVYPPVEMKFNHEANLLDYLFAPSLLSPSQIKEASDIAIKIISQLEMVGILAVEMFVTADGKILVNEMAPRAHNSGHQTIEANHTSQYEQILRAIYNMPLGSTEIIASAVMFNLLGEKGFTGLAQYEGIDELLKVEGVHIHLYGKTITKPFRKMGHVTVTHNNIEEAIFVALTLKEKIKVKTGQNIIY
jgi:5-(carboxyamino)imidazole ribonucleotide synthase